MARKLAIVGDFVVKDGELLCAGAHGMEPVNLARQIVEDFPEIKVKLLRLMITVEEVRTEGE